MQWYSAITPGCQGLRVGGNGELAFNGYRVSVWDDGKVLEMIVMMIYNIVNVHLNMVKTVNSMLCIFYHIKKQNNRRAKD